MENPTMTSTQLVADSYASYHRSVYLYIYYRINSKEEAEDLSQDVFLRLMDYKKMLRHREIFHSHHSPQPGERLLTPPL